MLVACLAAAGIAAARPGTANARTVARGICDPSIISLDTQTEQPATLTEVQSGLHAAYVRFTVSWAQAEPTEPTSDGPGGVVFASYWGGVAAAVAKANEDHLKVIITFYDVPRWASDTAFWKLTGGDYEPYDAMSAANLGDFKNFCQAVATQFQSQVYAYECWNEPNLSLFLYPQVTAHDKNYGAHLYIKMLRSCSAGIRAGDPKGALVVAGTTSPRGSATPNALSTSPQRFAVVIKAAKVGSLFDAYSHHPYMPGASPRLWPEAAPAHPETTVTLENLGTLLKLFPTKPFLLTEYGVQTAACGAFSGQHVSQVTQANYLRRAYAYVARYRQVKMLMWYLLKDESPAGAPRSGFYTGLETSSGVPKPSWYVFAGGNRLTLAAPTSIQKSTALTLTGYLSDVNGRIAGKQLVVQSHRAGNPWSTAKTVVTQSTGQYTLSLWPKASTYYRVAFLGVVTSRARFVAVQ